MVPPHFWLFGLDCIGQTHERLSPARAVQVRRRRVCPRRVLEIIGLSSSISCWLGNERQLRAERVARIAASCSTNRRNKARRGNPDSNRACARGTRGFVQGLRNVPNDESLCVERAGQPPALWRTKDVVRHYLPPGAFPDGPPDYVRRFRLQDRQR